MESSLSKEIKVGIFTVLGLVVIMVSILLLGGDQLLLRRTYQLNVYLNDVQGLARGSVVSLVGVPVGNVDSIQFQDDKIKVALDVDSSFKKRITVGSIASVKTQGALGDKYIYIEPGPLGADPLPAGGTLKADNTPGLLEMISQKGAQLGEVIEVIKEVHKFVESLNQDGRSAELMRNLADGSRDFKVLMSDARSKTLPKLDSILDKVDRGDGTLGALVNDRSIFNRISQMLGHSPRNHFLTPLIRSSIKESEKH